MSQQPANRRRKAHAPTRRVSAAALVALMALALASVLHQIGLLEVFDVWVLGWFSELAQQFGGLTPWPPAAVGIVLGIVLFGLVWTMIETPGLWRRLVLWISCGAVILGAIPVAALTGGWIMPGPLVIAWLWSGAWALAFARLHPPSARVPEPTARRTPEKP